MNKFLKCGAVQKFLVLKIEDFFTYLHEDDQIIFDELFDKVNNGRKADYKKDNEYLVINTDEPYINEIIDILKKNNHWGENNNG